MAHALKASIPKGALAENAAMCEPMPGDPPGNISDQELAALRQGRPDANDSISAGDSTPASRVTGSSREANEGEGKGKGKQTATGGAASSSAASSGVEAGRGGSNAPGSDPGHIKQVVEEETLRGQD